MKTNNIRFFITYGDIDFECDNIVFSVDYICDKVDFFGNKFLITSLPFEFYDLVFKFEECNTYFYDLVKR